MGQSMDTQSQNKSTSPQLKEKGTALPTVVNQDIKDRLDTALKDVDFKTLVAGAKSFVDPNQQPTQKQINAFNQYTGKLAQAFGLNTSANRVSTTWLNGQSNSSFELHARKRHIRPGNLENGILQASVIIRAKGADHGIEFTYNKNTGKLLIGSGSGQYNDDLKRVKSAKETVANNLSDVLKLAKGALADERVIRRRSSNQGAAEAFSRQPKGKVY